MTWARDLSADGWLLFATCWMRNFAYGFLSVIFGLYLISLGLHVAAVGAIVTAVLAGGAALTLVLTSFADRVGRRLVLMAGAVLMAISGAAFAWTSQPALLTAAAILGSMSPSGKDVGPFLSIEQAILPQTSAPARRTELFAAYNIVNYIATAMGAAIAGAPSIVGIPVQDGFRLLFLAYAVVGVLLLALFARLSPMAEAQEVTRVATSRLFGLQRSRGVVAKLAALFALDSFAGGFVVQSLIAVWFSLRFGAGPGTIGAIFFGTNLLAGASFLAAAPLARRFGLLNTMVFTHLPSNVLLLFVPLMPTVELAVAVLLVRFLLSQLDVPTRQSYTMAIVDPSERAAAGGILAVSRNAAAALAPLFAGATLSLPVLGLPFLLAGGLKILYDLAIFQTFRRVRPPEEQTVPSRA
ncbi:MAG TPA: MFS transporter [Chloroflexota bacterium]|nr:MFS transporter [Chloroflexota bacterium]